MNQTSFNENINSILEDGTIENISIPNVHELKSIVLENNLNKILFDGFKSNYKDMYGDDPDYLVMKIQDLLYRLDLFINHILKEKMDIKNEEDIYDAVFNYVLNNSTLYDAVSYDDSDLEDLENETINQSEELIIK